MNAGPGLFRCPRCGETKPRTPAYFYFVQTGKRAGQVTGFCRTCHPVYCRERTAGRDPYERHRRRLYLRAYYRAHYSAAARAAQAGR